MLIPLGPRVEIEPPTMFCRKICVPEFPEEDIPSFYPGPIAVLGLVAELLRNLDILPPEVPIFVLLPLLRLAVFPEFILPSMLYALAMKFEAV